MKKSYIIFIIFISRLLAIGLQGLVIPQNAQILSTSGAGIAADIDPALNPAMNESNDRYLQFSLNRWLGDLSGSYTLFRWGNQVPKQVSVQTWSAKELELWGNYPNDSPLGTFGVHWAAASFSMSHHLNTPYRFGIRIQTNYSHLFTTSLSGITLDGGTIIPVGSSLKLGAVIRNVGYEYTNNLRSKLPIESGIGMAINVPFVKTSIVTDLLYNTFQGQEWRIGITSSWKWLNFKIGTSVSENRNANSMGFSFNYRRWEINYGIYFHDNSAVLGTPTFLDVRCYL